MQMCHYTLAHHEVVCSDGHDHELIEVLDREPVPARVRFLASRYPKRCSLLDTLLERISGIPGTLRHDPGSGGAQIQVPNPAETPKITKSGVLGFPARVRF